MPRKGKRKELLLGDAFVGSFTRKVRFPMLLSVFYLLFPFFLFLLLYITLAKSFFREKYICNIFCAVAWRTPPMFLPSHRLISVFLTQSGVAQRTNWNNNLLKVRFLFRCIWRVSINRLSICNVNNNQTFQNLYWEGR